MLAELARRHPRAGLTALRWGAMLTVVTLFWQFLTAGGLLGGDRAGAEVLHATGAVLLHVVNGVALAGAVLAQAYVGGPATIGIHAAGAR